MVVHGHDTTLPVTMEDMLLHCRYDLILNELKLPSCELLQGVQISSVNRAVARGARRPLLVGDMPFGSYEQSPQHVRAFFPSHLELYLLKEAPSQANFSLVTGSVQCHSPSQRRVDGRCEN